MLYTLYYIGTARNINTTTTTSCQLFESARPYLVLCAPASTRVAFSCAPLLRAKRYTPKIGKNVFHWKRHTFPAVRARAGCVQVFKRAHVQEWGERARAHRRPAPRRAPFK